LRCNRTLGARTDGNRGYLGGENEHVGTKPIVVLDTRGEALIEALGILLRQNENVLAWDGISASGWGVDQDSLRN
jgi:hypothetical protein